MNSAGIDSLFQALAETTSEIVFIADADGFWNYVNSQFEGATGVASNSALGQGWQQAIDPKGLPLLLDEFRHAQQAKEMIETHCQLRTVSGFRRFALRQRPMLNPDNEIIGWTGTFADIEDLVTAEDALRLTKSESSELKAKIIHDIRNWAGPLQNGIEMLRSPNANAIQKDRALAIITGQMQSLRAVLESFYDQPPPQRKPRVDDENKKPVCKILVASNDEKFSEEWSLLLRVAGHDTRIAHTVAETFSQAASFQPNVVAIDCDIASPADSDLAVNLRQGLMHQKPILIALCGGDAANIVPPGYDAALSKPFKVQNFLTMIEQADLGFVGKL
jgi:PAS domain S-box-containing protein